ncbi:MAG TPA: hypothetical protein VMR59_01330 [Patescibacteria group bacterium]|jgi:hypothetical protein|nr:hypothetical protein [Patescibacteria group bacterium]
MAEDAERTAAEKESNIQNILRGGAPYVPPPTARDHEIEHILRGGAPHDRPLTEKERRIEDILRGGH